MKEHESIGIGIPEILLPNSEIDPKKWAVVACDQFTSEPEYWEQVSEIVGDSPSTNNLIYPEVYLNEANPEKRISDIRSTMSSYLEEGVFQTHEGMIYLEREVAGKPRKGLMLCVDLEKYDYTKGSSSLIRATEGTIVDRLPPRIKIREGAAIELPHIMVLIDDPEDTVIGPLTGNRDKLETVYDFNLMQGSGHLAGYAVTDTSLEDGVVSALENLADAENFTKKYNLPDGTPVLLFAMGDGNHSLATAKAIWEKTKEQAADKEAVLNEPTRYALIELGNLHDETLVFEPIHRALFGLEQDIMEQMKAYFGENASYTAVASQDEMTEKVIAQGAEGQLVGMIAGDEFGIVEIRNPESNLPVGSLQNFLDDFMGNKGAEEIDYVHGTDVVVKLGQAPGNCGFFLPSMDKNELFKTVILDGALPRKTFSMGEADEKRFYMECRRIG